MSQVETLPSLFFLEGVLLLLIGLARVVRFPGTVLVGGLGPGNAPASQCILAASDRCQYNEPQQCVGFCKADARHGSAAKKGIGFAATPAPAGLVGGPAESAPGEAR